MAELVKPDTSAWVRQVVSRARSDYNERNDLMLGIRRQRFLRAKVRPPQPYQAFLGDGVKVPISQRLVQTVIGAVAGEERPRWHVISPDPELSTRVENWLRLSEKAQERFTQPGLYWRFWDSLAGDGTAVLKTSRRPWGEYPRRAHGEDAAVFTSRVKEFFDRIPPLPWRTRVVDPMTFFPPRSEWGTPICIEQGLRPAAKVMQALGLRPNMTGGLRPVGEADEPVPEKMGALQSSMAPYIPVTEVWVGDDDLFVDVSGQVWHFDNDLGRLPYIWAFASAVAFTDPTLQGQSVAFPLIYLEPWVNHVLSTLVGFSQLQSTPTPYTTQQGGPVGTETKITDFKAGQFHEFGPGVTPGTWDMGQPTTSVEVLNAMTALAERFTISPVPAFAGTRTAGTVMAQVAERILSILRPLVDQAQVAWSNQGKMWVELVRDIVKSPVIVSGLTFEESKGRRKAAQTAILPSEINRISDVVAEIRFRTTTDRISWDTHNVMMQQSGVWSMKRARLESDVDDPDAEERQRTIELLMQSPAVIAFIQQRGLEDQPPLAALQQFIASAGGEAAGGNGAEGGVGLPPGATTGVPRAPGGTRQATAPKGRLRG